MQLKVQKGVSSGLDHLQGDADTNLSSVLLPYSHYPDPVNQNFPCCRCPCKHLMWTIVFIRI